ncbi:MAG: NUDIX domain-containing protein [Treponema sp.]|jgi:8-oxo-dGTP pyrophosphatase MutT (NUDIX family)|nr:NUDIX domain-containing protein [Treponema sp.]
MFTFCPSCASKNIAFEKDKYFHCPDCGFVYYHNTAAATGCVIEADGRLLFLVRGKEPAKGKLDLPGGFVDPDEGALEGLYREIREELGWSPPFLKGEPFPKGASNAPGAPLNRVFNFLASFSNRYPYKNIIYNTCDMYFYLSAPGLCERDLTLEKGEIAAVRFLKPEEIDFGEIAFDSTRRAVQAYLSSVK